MITLRLLGSAFLQRSDELVSGSATQRRRLALLALLAASEEAGVSRDKLLAFLWPEITPERGRHLLANAIYALRQALGREVILSSGKDVLRLNPLALRVDLWEFRAALERGEPQRAVELYAGPLLDGFFLSELPEFERWVESERDRVARLYVGALESLAQQRETEGDVGAAMTWWRRMSEHDPFNSLAALRLMRALERLGDRAGALQHARAHATLLRQELGIEPDDEVIAFAERLQAQSPRERSSRAGQQSSLAETPPSPQGIGADSGGPNAADGAAGAIPDRVSAPLSAPARGRRAWLSSGTAILTGTLAILLLLGGLLTARVNGRHGGEGTQIQSLAVLPLENCTPDPRSAERSDPEQEYFADGLTDALRTELAQIPGVRVISRASSMMYKGECGSRSRRDKSLPEIARELGVDAVVEGTLVRDRERVRVNVQLIRAATDEHLWAEGLEYEGGVHNVLALQQDIVTAIAGSMRVQTNTAALPLPSPARSADPAAYTLYLKGRYLGNQGRLAEALDHFQRAISIDSGFAPAFAGVADVYVHFDDQGTLPRPLAQKRGLQAAHRALQLDEGLSEAHASLAHLLMHAEDWAGAGRAYRRSIELNPSNGSARILYAFYLSAREHHEDAIEQAVRALETDPLSKRTHLFAGYTLYFARRYPEAISQWQRLLEMDPESVNTHFLIAYAHLNAGRRIEGLGWARRGAALAKGSPGSRVALAHCLALAEQQDEARRILTEVDQEGGNETVDPLNLARAYARVGDPDASLRWLNKALEEDHGWLMFLRVDPGYHLLRGDPRFAALLRDLRLDS